MAPRGQDPKQPAGEPPQVVATNWFGEDFRRFAKEYRTPISSSMASVLSTAITFPLDFAKSRMQSYNTKFVPTIAEAYKADGLRGFWRGVLPPFVSVTAVRTASFSIYQTAKYRYAAYFERVTGESPLDIANAPGRYPTISTMLCFGAAGATAGSIVTVLACPFELNKVHSQLQSKMAKEQKKPDTNSGSWPLARQLIRDRGIAGLYSGYRLHLIRDTIGTCMYFTTYETAKQIMGNARGNSPTSPLAVMAGGGLCGIVSWTVTYPIDVAKTVYVKALLTNPHKAIEKPKIYYFRKSSYRGLGVSVARSCLINMIFFSMFEVIKKRINQLTV